MRLEFYLIISTSARKAALIISTLSIISFPQSLIEFCSDNSQRIKAKLFPSVTLTSLFSALRAGDL